MSGRVRQFALLLLLIGAAASPASPSPPQRKSGAPGAGCSAWADLTASMKAMHRAMGSVEPSGDIDTDFVRLMLPHHQAAIDMARTELLCGKDSQIRRLAQEIITDQQSEIELMRLWLKEHEKRAPK